MSASSSSSGSFSVFEYGDFAGCTTIDDAKVTSRDQYGNAKNTSETCYDLVRDDACKGCCIAVLDCWASEGGATGVLSQSARDALRMKGFELVIWNNAQIPGDLKFPPSPSELREKLQTCSQVWVISSNKLVLTAALQVVIQEFYDNGNGVLVWGDNDPMNVDANALLHVLLPGSSMSGSHCGEGTVITEAKDAGVTGFRPHLVTTGLDNLYEGHTIAQLNLPQLKEAVILAHSSAGTVAIAAVETKGRRILLDSGWTKLFVKWDSAGTARYVVNAAAWLVNAERRIADARATAAAKKAADAAAKEAARQRAIPCQFGKECDDRRSGLCTYGHDADAEDSEGKALSDTKPPARPSASSQLETEKVEAAKLPCKFGGKCYRSNPQHLAKFSHPGRP